MPTRVFLCVSIDCECDKGPGWRTRRPLSFTGVHSGIAERLHPLFVQTRTKPTYLLSPELLRDPRCVERLASLDGCELATHLHGELADPGAFEPAVTSALQRDYPPATERAKLQWLTAAFRNAFGRPPRSFRAGRFGAGKETLPILEELGYAVDSSVTPYIDWTDLSPGLSYANSPEQPYHPDRHDPGRPGDCPVLEVPVTIRPRALGRLPIVGKRFEHRWLRPTKNDGPALVALARDSIRSALRARPGGAVVLNAMLHNVEAVAGASPYASRDGQARKIVSHLAELLQFARSEGFSGIGLADVPEVTGEADI